MAVTPGDPMLVPPMRSHRANAPNRTTMVAQAVLARGQYSWVWVVPTCPYCSKPHDHYGGSLESDPTRYLEQVFPARCDQTDRRRLMLQYPSADLRYLLASTIHQVA